MNGPIERAVQDIAIVKAAALPVVNNSTTLVDDAEMKFPMVANGSYRIELLVLLASDAAPDGKIKLDLPVGAVFDGRSNFVSTGGTHTTATFNEGTTGTVLGIGAAVPSPSFLLLGIVQNGATAGDFQVQFAQQAANVSNTTLAIGSYLIRRRLA